MLVGQMTWQEKNQRQSEKPEATGWTTSSTTTTTTSTTTRATITTRPVGRWQWLGHVLSLTWSTSSKKHVLSFSALVVNKFFHTLLMLLLSQLLWSWLLNLLIISGWFYQYYWRKIVVVVVLLWSVAFLAKPFYQLNHSVAVIGNVWQR